MIVLLFRAAAAQKRLIADLEERGISVTADRSGGEGEKKSTKGKLKRNVIAPYGRKGWGVLASREEVGDGGSVRGMKSKGVIKGQLEEEKKSSRAFWFFGRKSSGTTTETPVATIRLTTIKGQQLSAIIESPPKNPETPPRPSADASESLFGSSPPILLRHIVSNTSGSSFPPFDDNEGSDALPCTPSSLIPEPLFSSTVPTSHLQALRKQRRATDAISRNPMFAVERKRSMSLCGQNAGDVPFDPAPPLPNGVMRLKEEERESRPSQRMSRHSISSMESTGSSILVVGGTTPALARSNSVLLQDGPKREWKISINTASRSGIGSQNGRLNHRLQSSIQSSVARYSRYSDTSEVLARDSNDPGLSSRLIQQSTPPGTMTPALYGSLAYRSMSTPRRYSKSRVNTFGSPTERKSRLQAPRLALQDVSGNQTCPTRQDSQNSQSSSRSSNGNPFQWDPAPLLSARDPSPGASASGKPSALKGSPNARKGHRRQNCVRIVLEPTILNPSRASLTPSTIHDIAEETAESDGDDDNEQEDASPQTARWSSRPPSVSVFAPHVVLKPTMLTASLTSTSPALSLAKYYTNHASADSSPTRRSSTRLSSGSVFSIPSFPSPGKNVAYAYQDLVAPTFSLTRPSIEGDRPTNIFSTDFKPQSVGSSDTPKRDTDGQRIQPEDEVLRSQSLLRVDDTSSPVTAHLPSDLLSSSPTASYSIDSPPCSPKTLRPAAFLPIPTTIDPAVLLQIGCLPNTSTYTNTFTPISNEPSPLNTKPSTLADTVIERSPYPSGRSNAPCSPRLPHATLPSLPFSFSSPQQLKRHESLTKPLGPRPAPTTVPPLCKAIAELRRMNSEATAPSSSSSHGSKKNGVAKRGSRVNERGNRRYLNIGGQRQESLSIRTVGEDGGDEGHLGSSFTDLSLDSGFDVSCDVNVVEDAIRVDDNQTRAEAQEDAEAFEQFVDVACGEAGGEDGGGKEEPSDPMQLDEGVLDAAVQSICNVNQDKTKQGSDADITFSVEVDGEGNVINNNRMNDENGETTHKVTRASIFSGQQEGEEEFEFTPFSSRGSSSTVTADDEDLAALPGMHCFSLEDWAGSDDVSATPHTNEKHQHRNSNNVVEQCKEGKQEETLAILPSTEHADAHENTKTTATSHAPADRKNSMSSVWEDGEHFWLEMVGEEARSGSMNMNMRPRADSNKENIGFLTSFPSSHSGNQDDDKTTGRVSRISSSETSKVSSAMTLNIPTSKTTMKSRRHTRSRTVSSFYGPAYPDTQTSTPTPDTPTTSTSATTLLTPHLATPSPIRSKQPQHSSSPRLRTALHRHAASIQMQTERQGSRKRTSASSHNDHFEPSQFRMKILRATPTRGSGGEWSRGEEGTPGSLYDGDGFLKGC